ncbi:MAG: hypothetical protein KC550_01315 [Nanoarchaeota archaeon]|nr:hypothetical protein [Nanoarchaeota archaeon]
MNVKEVTSKLKEVREASTKRNFTQNFDLIFNLQNMDLKKPECKVDVGVPLTCKLKSKKLKICAVVDHSINGADKVFDKVVFSDELSELKGNMKKLRELTQGYDKFVVQANHMPLFAQVLGRFLGPMNKMPSPKLGMIITAKTPLAPLYEKIQKTVHLQTKKNLVIQATVGSEKESDAVIAENIVHVYESLLHALPNQKNNVKNVNVKLTMGKLVAL